jgi:hypothetical protein
VNEQQTPKPRLRLGLAVSQARQPLPWGNSGTGGPPLPRRKDDHAPRTPSAALRREAFARRHPEIPVTARREGTRLVFEVAEPGKPAEVHHDADAMMDDLETRYP